MLILLVKYTFFFFIFTNLQPSVMLVLNETRAKADFLLIYSTGWRCKRYGHRTGDKECPFFIKGNQKLEQFRVVSGLLTVRL